MIYSLKKNSASISRVLYPRGVSIINLEQRITTHFYCFLPSSLREQRSGTGILGIAAHSMLVSLPPCGLFVAFAGTKHCCLTAVNRCGALCCPDFPRSRGLKPQFFFPYSAIDRYTVFALSCGMLINCCKPIPTRSGIRESNPPPRLGKPMHYRCANAANSVQWYRKFCGYANFEPKKCENLSSCACARLCVRYG